MPTTRIQNHRRINTRTRNSILAIHQISDLFFEPLFTLTRYSFLPFTSTNVSLARFFQTLPNMYKKINTKTNSTIMGSVAWLSTSVLQRYENDDKVSLVSTIAGRARVPRPQKTILIDERVPYLFLKNDTNSKTVLRASFDLHHWSSFFLRTTVL